MMEDLIDFQCSDTFRDAYFQQGLTVRHSPQYLSAPSPQFRPNGHNLVCVCRECWWGREVAEESTEINRRIDQLWRVMQGLRPQRAKGEETTRNAARPQRKVELE